MSDHQDGMKLEDIERQFLDVAQREGGLEAIQPTTGPLENEENLKSSTGGGGGEDDNDRKKRKRSRSRDRDTRRRSRRCLSWKKLHFLTEYSRIFVENSAKIEFSARKLTQNRIFRRKFCFFLARITLKIAFCMKNGLKMTSNPENQHF